MKMANHRPVEVIKAIYAPNSKPIEPVRTEDMDDADWEEAQAEYKKEYEEWVQEEKEAEAMRNAPEDPTDNPGPGVGIKPLVDAENPVWENPKFYKEGPGAIKD